MLLNLAKVQRFDMTLMFMSGTDKKGKRKKTRVLGRLYCVSDIPVMLTGLLSYSSHLCRLDLVAVFQHLNAQLKNQTSYSEQDLASLASKFKTKY